MMAVSKDNKFALFSRISVGNSRDNEYEIGISLECDDELNIELSSPREIVTYEAFSNPTPRLIVTFVDARGDLMNAKKLDAAATYTLTFGSYSESIIQSKWKLSHIEHQNGSLGQSKLGVFSLHFVHESWQKLYYETHTRGWSNSSYSDVVSELADECGFDVTDIIDSSPTFETIQQPGWSNAMFLDWIAKRAKSSIDSGEYEYSLSIDNKFVFAPLASYIRKKFKIRESSSNDDVMIYVGSPPLSMQVRRSERSSNAVSEFTAQSYHVVEDSCDRHAQGAGGVNLKYYDYDNDEYKITPVKYSESDNIQLSEWSLVNEEWETSSFDMDCWRNSQESEAMANNRINSIVNSMMKVKVSVPASTVLRVGEIVNLQINNPPPFSEDQGSHNEIYSGRYIIGEVTNRVSINKKGNIFVSDLLLLRQGIDKKESDYYVRSSGGKD